MRLLTGLGDPPTFSGLTASRLIATDGTKKLASVAALSSWIVGTANQVSVTDNGSGAVTLATPQNIDTGASPTFVGLTLSGLTNTRLVFAGAAGVLSGSANLTWSGTALSITGTTPLALVSSAGNCDFTLTTADGAGSWDIAASQITGYFAFYNITNNKTPLRIDPTSLDYTVYMNAGGVSVGGLFSATAKLHLPAGTATAGTAPCKFTSGTLLTSAEAGAVEFLTDKFYGTITTGAARKELALVDATLSSGRVALVTTNGRLNDNANLTFDGTTLTSTAFLASAGTATVAPGKFTAGTNLTNAAAGAIEFDGVTFSDTIDTTSGRAQRSDFQLFQLTADGSALGPTIADAFGANSAFPMVASGTYEIEYYVRYLKTTAGTVTWTMTFSGAVTNWVGDYVQSAVTGEGAESSTLGAGLVTQTTTAAFPASATTRTTAVNHFVLIRVLVTCGATPRNIRLSVTSSAGTVTIRRGSFYKARRLAVGNVGTFAA
jgi:hypothetical protein